MTRQLHPDETSVTFGEHSSLCEVKIVPGPGMLPDMLFVAIVDGSLTHSVCFDISSETSDTIKEAIEYVFKAHRGGE